MASDTIIITIGLVLFAAGLVYVIYKPFSRVFGDGYKKIDPIIGLIIIIIGGYTLVSGFSNTQSDNDIKNVIIQQIEASENEDLDALLAYIHEESPQYNRTKDGSQEAFDLFDFDYDIHNITILKKTDQGALVRVVFTTRMVNSTVEMDYRDNTITVNVALKKSGNSYKVFETKQEDIIYLE